ncbi:hypothetical protein FB446DRAFT_272525 [Lentinula raphanica]|nr:hypothetical protein FB446DRAFT_272525 [Lentinula raphanica]
MYPTSLNLAKIAISLIVLFGVRALPAELRRDMMQTNTHNPLIAPRNGDSITVARPRDHTNKFPNPEQLPDNETFIFQWTAAPGQVVSKPAVLPNDDTDNWFLFESQLPTLFRMLNDYNEYYLDHTSVSVPGGSHVKVIYNYYSCSFKNAAPGGNPNPAMLYAYIYAKQNGATTRTWIAVHLGAQNEPVFHHISAVRHLNGRLTTKVWPSLLHGI